MLLLFPNQSCQNITYAVKTMKPIADNFVEDVLGGFQFEVATPYVLYRNKLDEV